MKIVWQSSLRSGARECVIWDREFWSSNDQTGLDRFVWQSSLRSSAIWALLRKAFSIVLFLLTKKWPRYIKMGRICGLLVQEVSSPVSSVARPKWDAGRPYLHNTIHGPVDDHVPGRVRTTIPIEPIQFQLGKVNPCMSDEQKNRRTLLKTRS
jgi:hypothetical protein